MSDERLGAIPLNGSAELVFSVGSWKGQMRAGVRIFLTSSRYTGATKKGLSLRGDVLAGILDALEAIERQVAVTSAGKQTRVAKSGQAEVVAGIVAADGRDSLPSIDVREFVQTSGYSGPTKSGVRFSWDKLPEVIALMRLQLERLGAVEHRQPTLLPEWRVDRLLVLLWRINRSSHPVSRLKPRALALCRHYGPHQFQRLDRSTRKGIAVGARAARRVARS